MWQAGKAFLARLGRDEISAYAAALTYNLLFALFPLTLALSALVSALHLRGAQAGLVSTLTAVVTPEVVRLISRPAHASTEGPLLAYVGGAGYLLGMSAAFRRLLEAFNHAYEYRPPWRRQAWWTVTLSILLALTVGLGLVAGMLLATLGQRLLHALFPASGSALLSGVRWLVLLALGTVLLAILYWLGPDRPRRFQLVSIGAVAAIAIWLTISFGFSVYLSHFNAYNVVYGSVGAVILLLLYLYFLSYALLLGAELNALVDTRHMLQAAGTEGRPPHG